MSIIPDKGFQPRDELLINMKWTTHNQPDSMQNLWARLLKKTTWKATYILLEQHLVKHLDISRYIIK